MGHNYRKKILIGKLYADNITFVASSPQDPIPPEELDALPDVVVKEEVDDDIYFDEVIFPTNSEESDHHQEIQPIIETTESSPSQHEVGHNSDDEPSQILTLDEDKKNFENCQSSKEHPLDYFSSSEHQPKSPSEKIKRRRRRKAKIQRVTHVPLPPPPTKYLCSKCGKEFKTSISLLSHEVTVCKILHDKLYLESRGLKRYECDHCDTKFVSHKDYERHYLRHISVKQHPCHQCGKSFKQIYNLRVHQKSACRQASEIDIAAKNKRLEVGRIIRAKYVHKCPNCSRKFPSTAKRDEHVANVHNETDEKFAICDICGVSISTKGGSGNMREHLSRVHLRVARWTCPHCKKGFFQKRDWASHVERVHGNIPGDKVT
ncbi:zinc finger protein 16 isoform X1 [Folsomia candida]|uniref:zinc finger protein 16 isoform X1 n=1 Tax=Folsomia candida TaxID=158441 RepID=UPI000B904E05|nr:zinc finger protein 16 isoform X1 [Folsomia candida]XP_035707916.1 zinc finger protein 16 isoform X1 [Folsomia candida]